MKNINYFLFIIVLSGFITNGCKKLNNGSEKTALSDTLITISRVRLIHIQENQVGCAGSVLSKGNEKILEKGVCWCKFMNPTILDDKFPSGPGSGEIITSINGLTAGTSYFMRAYATTLHDTLYGEETSFTTLTHEVREGTFTDERDGKAYRWIKIGSQTWMAENLAYLPSVSPPNIGSVSLPYYYVFGYFGTNVSEARNYYYTLYGVDYNWEAALNGAPSSDKDPSGVRGTCPVGWHLPSNAEWDKLIDYVKNDGFTSEGPALKTTYGWFEGSGNGTDDYGFSALPNGGRADEEGGKFGSIGVNAHWWSSQDDGSPSGWMWDITVDVSSHQIINGYPTNKAFAFGIRCVKD